MAMSSISIEVDADTAQAYAAASVTQRQKLQLLLSLRLRELTTIPPRRLAEIVAEIGAGAEAKGLTDAELESLLHDD